MKKTLFRIMKTIFAGIVALVLLSVVTYFYKYTPEKLVNKTGATDFVYKPNSRISNYREGSATFYVDDNGFNNSHTKANGVHPDILLMGSSHMFASEVGQDENAGFLLNEMLPQMSVYNIGMASHNFGVCLKNLENAIEQYKPKQYVIVETSSVVLKEKTIDDILNGKMQNLNVYTNPIVGITQTVFPSVKRILLDIDTWIDMDRTNTGDGYEPDFAKLQNGIESLMDYVECIEKKYNIKILIVYHPILSIDAGGSFEDDPERKYVDMFNQICNKKKIGFINLYSKFKEEYETASLFAHGFNNSENGKGHMNRNGHRWFAEAVQKYILGDE